MLLGRQAAALVTASFAPPTSVYFTGTNVQILTQKALPGRQAAALVTASFAPPISLEFEKVYCPYLMFAKKHYAGLIYTESPHRYAAVCRRMPTYADALRSPDILAY
jgi:DNA polymerase delta subunit 1